jgi:hypothetical protein
LKVSGQCYQPSIKASTDLSAVCGGYLAASENDPGRRKPIIETMEKSSEFKAALHYYPTLKDVLKNQLQAIAQGVWVTSMTTSSSST